MQDYRKLDVWELAQRAAVEVYQCSAVFPREERYGVTAQLRRAAVSVGSNLAEGLKRSSPVDKARFLNIAQGSAAEVGSLLDVATRLGYITTAASASLADRFDHIAAMLARLRDRVRQG